MVKEWIENSGNTNTIGTEDSTLQMAISITTGQKEVEDPRDYWDAVAVVCHPGERQIVDNFDKKSQIVRFLLGYELMDKKTIEIGVGNGLIAHTIRTITGNGMKYWGTDLSEKFRETATKLFNLSVHEADLKELKMEGEQFDYLWAFDVLEHIPLGDRKEIFVELSRVLKKEAKVFINNPLTASQHVDKFDFWFDDYALAQMCDFMGMQIKEIKKYSCRNHSYQFMVLER